MSIYLDYNATAPLYPEVLTKMQEFMGKPYNPSSVHAFGREAKKHLENARQTIATTIAAWPNEIIFTASATEANAAALRGFPGRRMLVSAIEHSSVLKAPGVAAYIPVDTKGAVRVSDLEELLARNDTPALVSVMLANNETGVIQPVREVAELCKKYGAVLHCDAVQALGKMPLDFGILGVDLMTISSHKCGGPLGAAALIVRNDLAFTPLLTGGGQELGRRAGTENLAAIMGFAAAVEQSTNRAHVLQVRTWLAAMEKEMEGLGATVFGKAAPRLPNTVCVSMPGVSNEVQLMDFDLKGFAVSAGSACSSGRIEGSHVLAAMNVARTVVSTAIRISGGWQTRQSDVTAFTEAWKALYKRLKTGENL